MRFPGWLIAAFVLFTSVNGAWAHALEPGYLDLRQLTPETWQVFWRKPDVNGAPMAIDAVLPDKCAPIRVQAPTSDGSAWVSAWVAECPDGLSGGTIAIDGLPSQRTDVLVRIQPLDTAQSTVRLTPDQHTYFVEAVPTTWSVFSSYFQLGFEHILEGLDHLLFVFALLVLIRDPWRLVAAVTAFTVAHSITLALAALDIVTVPGPPVEAIIALSIVFLAVEILKHDPDRERLSERFPWVVSFSFGLLHGLGFAGALKEIGLPQGDIPAALLAFNIGVEAGQLTFVAAILAIIGLVRMLLPGILRSIRGGSTPVTTALGYGIGCVATIWLAERLTGF